MKTARNIRRELERKYSQKKIYSNKEIIELARAVKYTLNIQQAEKILEKLPKDVISKIEGEPLPDKISKLRSIELLDNSINIQAELSWAVKLILKYKNEINKFIELENNFNKFMLLANYELAEEILDEIETKICFSQWGIEKRLFLAEYQHGLAKQKEELNKVNSENNDVLVQLFSNYQSLRVEKKLPTYKFESFLEKQLNIFHSNKPKDYFKLKLTPFIGFNINSPEYIIFYESTSSIIDRYNSLVQILLSVACNVNNKKNIDIFKVAINVLNDNIADTRLANAFNYFGNYNHPELKFFRNDIIQVLDKYTEGRYEDVLTQVTKIIMESPEIFELYELYLKSLIFSKNSFINIFNEDSIAGRTLANLWHILNKDDETFDALFDMQKYMYAFGWSTWSCRLSTYLHQEYNTNDESFNEKLFSLLNSCFVNPILSTYISSTTQSVRFINEVESRLNNESSTLNLCKKLIKVNENNLVAFNTRLVSDYRLSIYDARALQEEADYEKAYEKYCEIEKSVLYKENNQFIPNYQILSHGQFICLLGLKNYKDAVTLATKVLLYNNHLIYKFEDQLLIDSLINSSDESIHELIQGVIYLNIYQANVNDLYIAYDNFMLAHGLTYPHQLKEIKGKFTQEEFVYFLKNICRQEVYASSYYFENQNELDNERIEVCLLLAEVDKENVTIYIEEISEITRSILIRKGIQQIDESKIYVDIKGIRKTLDKDLKESFHRYLELSSVTVSQLDKIVLDEALIISYLGQKTNKDVNIESLEKDIKISTYSQYKAFTDIFFRVRDKFIASNEFGLDTYLSTRIRHGTLLGHIRSIFEKLHLITIKDSSTGSYLPNEYWLENLQQHDQDRLKEYESILSKFSEDIDNISEELKNRYLQVSTEVKQNEGLFNYSYHKINIIKLYQSQFIATKDYDTFITLIIEELWNRTEENLIKIRKFLLEDEKEKFLSRLSNLLDTINNLEKVYPYFDLKNLKQNILKCQTDISIELERIARWFQRTNNKTINEFDIGLPLEASLQVIKKIYPSFQNLNLTINNESSILFEGEFFPQFTDIIQILLDNIIKHSQMNINDLKVDINISEANNKLLISVINNFSRSLNIRDVNARIDNTRGLLLGDTNDDSIRGENKSGYPKLKKILYNDLSCDEVDISIKNVNEKREFTVKISFNTNNLTKDHYEMVIN